MNLAYAQTNQTNGNTKNEGIFVVKSVDVDNFMKAVVLEIEECKGKINLCSQKIEGLNSEINSLTNQMVDLMAFGKQTEKVSELQKLISEKTESLSDAKESKEKWIHKLSELGNKRFQVQEEIKKKKEQEKHLRSDILEGIKKEQMAIHEEYNKLEKIKIMIEEGYDFSPFLVGGQLHIDNMFASLQSQGSSK
ncbi:hypothetical protein [Bacillus thuringiensis]|uniref:hypothetical protein n=1 Tax=Bacillus thuringiensis TaxID=1428 RepID=UPI0021D690A6|nr:hypothetical protein [Bacillus thuringiensis]MCU7667558.1 hypothetical protein [Bacillus thuringiensis]